MSKYATACRGGSAEAETILTRFPRRHGPPPTEQALLEGGHAVTTGVLGRALHAEAFRRASHEGRQVLEPWKSAHRFIVYGRGGAIAAHRQDDQELALFALPLLQMAMVDINPLLMQQVLTDATWWARMPPAALRALPPLIYAPVTPYGTCNLERQARLPLAAAEDQRPCTAVCTKRCALLGRW